VKDIEIKKTCDASQATVVVAARVSFITRMVVEDGDG
jgi:hypothetical protein